MFLTAELCQWSWLGGWASAFHSYAIAGILFCLLWLLWVYDTPAKASKISDAEYQHIHDDDMHRPSGGKMKPRDIPWRRILSSPVVWSTAMCSFSQNFMNVGTVVYLPSYYSSILKMDLSSVRLNLRDLQQIPFRTG
jgi:sugar phosphate permease